MPAFGNRPKSPEANATSEMPPRAQRSVREKQVTLVTRISRVRPHQQRGTSLASNALHDAFISLSRPGGLHKQISLEDCLQSSRYRNAALAQLRDRVFEGDVVETLTVRRMREDAMPELPGDRPEVEFGAFGKFAARHRVEHGDDEVAPDAVGGVDVFGAVVVGVVGESVDAVVETVGFFPDIPRWMYSEVVPGFVEVRWRSSA